MPDTRYTLQKHTLCFTRSLILRLFRRGLLAYFAAPLALGDAGQRRLAAFHVEGLRAGVAADQLPAVTAVCAGVVVGITPGGPEGKKNTGRTGILKGGQVKQTIFTMVHSGTNNMQKSLSWQSHTFTSKSCWRGWY